VPLEAAEFLTLPGDGDCLRRHVTAQRAYYDWVVEGRARSPLIEAAFDRLEDLWPPDPGTPVLNWGDARIGNVVYDGFEPAAVLDWEMAALAPPRGRPRLEYYTLYAALRHAIVMRRVAYRQVHFGEVAVPADPDTLILHHGSLRAMVQGSYWD